MELNMLFFFLKDLAWVMCEKQCILTISFHPTAETKLLLLLKQKSVKTENVFYFFLQILQ